MLKRTDKNDRTEEDKETEKHLENILVILFSYKKARNFLYF